jgi:hypothetical protein
MGREIGSSTCRGMQSAMAEASPLVYWIQGLLSMVYSASARNSRSRAKVGFEKFGSQVCSVGTKSSRSGALGF